MSTPRPTPVSTWPMSCASFRPAISCCRRPAFATCTVRMCRRAAASAPSRWRHRISARPAMTKRTKFALRCCMATAGLSVCLTLADWLFPPDLSRYRAVCTEVLARDGTKLAAQPAPGGVWRLRTNIADVDPRYLELLVAAEDRHFWRHPGIDPAALLRAAWQWARAGRIVSG